MKERRRRDSATLAGWMIVSLLVATPAQAQWDWATGPALADQEKKGKQWSVEIVPYLWVASLDGEVGIPRVGTIPVSATFNNVKDNLDTGFAGTVDIRFRRWHLLSDNFWIRLKDDVVPGLPIFTRADIESEFAYGTVGVGYELPLKTSFAWDVYLAARWWHVNTGVALQAIGPIPPLLGRASETWADAVVGTRLRYSITDSWRVAAAADVGAGDSDLTWQVEAGVTYMFNDHVGLTGAYRFLGVDYSSESFVYDVMQHGLLVGLNLGF
ncbi:MAG: hypothetical protein O7G30_10450 [Proteobacteria bacterium]|nr:hypothetical protein [Pseudomonadota bacterium]